MNILLVSREFPPETAFGGIATFVQLLARGLTAAGHSVVVLSQTFGAEREEQDELEPRVRVLRLAVPRLGPLDPARLSLHLFAELFAQRVARAAADLYRSFPFDLIETPDHLAEGLHCLPFAQARGIPVVTRLYSPWSLLAEMGLHLPGAGDAATRAALRSMEERLLRQSDALTAPSRDLARRVAAHFHLHADITFIPNPVDTARFHPPPPDPAAPSSPAGAPLALLFVGRLEDRKGCQDLPAVWEALRPWHAHIGLTVLGPDTPNTGRSDQTGRSMLAQLLTDFTRRGFGPALRNRHAANGTTAAPPGVAGPAAPDPDRRPAAGCLELTPRVPLADLARVYRAHDLLLAPSRYDNSPYTVIEAMASGLAVVATDAGGSAEYLGPVPDAPRALSTLSTPPTPPNPRSTPIGPGGFRPAVGGRLVRPGDIAGMVAAIRSLLALDRVPDPAASTPPLDPALPAFLALRRAGRERILALCDPAEVVRRTLELYDRARARKQIF